MKITFKGTFTVDNIKLIYDFIEQQLTTDGETKSTTIEVDSAILIKVITDKYGDIEKLHFRKINGERK